MEFQAYTITNHPDWACIQAKAPDSQQRTPVHLCCVIDTSASMDADNKLKNVKNSLQFLLNFLGPDDKLSLVTFSDNASIILKQVCVTDAEKENIRARISLITIEANTNLGAGLIRVRDCLFKENANRKQGILLLTDGIANLGIQHTPHLEELVEKTITLWPGTSLSCIGYGTDHNVPLLQQMSAVGGGSYYVVNNLEDVATVFGDVLGGLTSCSFQQIRVVFPLKTTIKTRYAIEKMEDHMEVIIGDLPAGMNAVFLANILPGAAVTLKGFTLANHYNFELSTRVQIANDVTLQTDGEAHYLRFNVLSLIDESRYYMNRHMSDAQVQEILIKLTLQMEIIEEYKKRNEHSLWDILLSELKQCKRCIVNRRHMPPDTPHVMSQHASTLGRLRGISASVENDVVEANAAAAAVAPVSTASAASAAFSNRIQRQISAELTQSLAPPRRYPRAEAEPGAVHADSDEEPGSPISSHSN